MHRIRSHWFLIVAALVALGACEVGASSPTPPAAPGTSDAPREVNLIAKDYLFVPDVLELIPGETILLHVINGGLEVHEAIIGDSRVQEAWEVAEAAAAGAPPGPTPLVSVPADVAGVRVVVHSGELVDLIWTVPRDAVVDSGWMVGCHIPGHAERGMAIPIEWIEGTSAP